jgi:hypothetical protein
MPMSPDELMDTGDYELYNPRVQGLRAREMASGNRSTTYSYVHTYILDGFPCKFFQVFLLRT